MTERWSIGLMTGTVLDGNIDIALLRTDGESIAEFGPAGLMPYPEGMTALLSDAMRAALSWNFEGPEPDIFSQAEKALTEAQAHAVNAFLGQHGIAASEVGVIGFHGQTMLHRPPTDQKLGRTRQLGDGPLMARITGIDVVYDLRSADMAAGGQGAPLAPVYHRALLNRIDAGADTAVLNLGGVANITWCDGAKMAAFDTGPANAPVNDWVRERTGQPYDHDGKIAARGQVDEARLARLLAHPYLTASYPKSLDRFDFSASMAESLSLEDGAALLCAFTASAVGKALDLLPSRPSRLVVCGGGRKNPVIMAELEKRARVIAINADNVGLRGDTIEAELFAYLAKRAVRGLPISFPETTGVKAPQTGGRFAPHA